MKKKVVIFFCVVRGDKFDVREHAEGDLLQRNNEFTAGILFKDTRQRVQSR